MNSMTAINVWSTGANACELTAALVRVAHVVRNLVEHQVLTEYELTWTDYQVLRVLARRRHIHSADVARSIGAAKATVSSTVTRLAQRGLVERFVPARDQRQVRLMITPAGRELWQQLARAVADVERRFAHTPTASRYLVDLSQQLRALTDAR